MVYKQYRATVEYSSGARVTITFKGKRYCMGSRWDEEDLLVELVKLERKRGVEV